MKATSCIAFLAGAIAIEGDLPDDCVFDWLSFLDVVLSLLNSDVASKLPSVPLVRSRRLFVT
jgi:hypothetical protein